MVSLTASLVGNKGLLAGLLVCAGLFGAAPARADGSEAHGHEKGPQGLVGTWLVQEKDGIFRIAPCGGNRQALCGTLVGMDYTEAEPERDSRGRSECGLEIVNNMTSRKDGRWHGRILDPRTGNHYQAVMWLDDAGVLKLRGYLGLAIFGETQRWTRIVRPAIGPRCRMRKSG